MNQIKLKSPTVLFLDSLDILRPHIVCIHPTYQIEFLQENSKKFRRPCIKNGKVTNCYESVDLSENMTFFRIDPSSARSRVTYFLAWTGRKLTATLFLLYALFQFSIEHRILYRIPNLLNFLYCVLLLPGFLRILIEPKHKFS
jgi:hypothetical protein